MSAPRELLPRKIRAVTRRCSQRQFFLRPSPLVNQILLYCLARAAEEFDVRIHAYCFMSSHCHMVLSDPVVDLPEFMHRLNLRIAKAMNTELGRRENLFAPGSYDHVTLEDDEAVLSAIVYALMNPVAAGLVRSGHQWPGLRSTPEDLAGRHIVARKAGRYFARSRAPEIAQFDLERPSICNDMTDAELVETVRQRVEEQEAEYQGQMASKNRKFLGRKRVLATSPMTTAASPEPLGKLNPRVAAGNRQVRIAAIQRLKAFYRAYNEALKQFLRFLRTDIQRAREAIFPAGTYLMRVRYSVRCQAPP